MNRIRIDELNGKTRFFGVAINTHEQRPLLKWSNLTTLKHGLDCQVSR